MIWYEQDGAGAAGAADLTAEGLTALSRPGPVMRERISRPGGGHLALTAMRAAPSAGYDAGSGHIRADVLITAGERDLHFLPAHRAARQTAPTRPPQADRPRTAGPTTGHHAT